MDQNNATAPVSIERISGLPALEFYQRFCVSRTPVILTDATAEWAARDLLTPRFLKKYFGWKPVRSESGWTNLEQVIKQLEASDPDDPAPYPILMLLKEDFPELLPFAKELPLAHSLPNRLTDSVYQGERFGSRTELFIGGPGGNFPYIHIDYYHMHAWINQLYGSKEFTIFPPSDGRYLYVNEDRWRSDIENPWDPDLEKFPLYAKATPTKFTLHPGETLFIPNGYWHTARSLDVTLSIAFDQLNATNMRGFMQDVWRFNKGNPRTSYLLARMHVQNAAYAAKALAKKIIDR